MEVHSGGDKQTIKSYHMMSYYDECQEEKLIKVRWEWGWEDHI